ncbi:uncharacterized protein LOC118478520 [Aplysia californica]|uniref:Uncharacterized protein LOC118478520 n=1 Tax=Aplysia californica TaxID=6500 RepID=A0ABM1W0K4_APLCA|nr:uncharacterized protein LOC118478520 [Aplysia californica]
MPCQDVTQSLLFSAWKEREFVARHIETTEPKVGKPNPRRSKTHAYYLTVNGKRLKVCRNTFLATLGISEKFIRVVLASSSKEYLPDLTLSKMYDMFVKENPCNDIPSFYTYRRVFKRKSLAFHSLKKDQCSLCNFFRKGDEAQKNELREIYNRHEAE